MPRDSNGNYTLPAGNPVVTGEVISTGWANPTMSDIGAELTNSLDRQGRGGMLAPFKFVDGTNSQPGMTWTNEPTTGFYRASGGDMRATVAGVARMRWTSSGVDVYDTVAGTWVALASASGVNFAVLNQVNKFTQPQTIVNTGGAWQLWKDTTPSLGGRFAFNVGLADSMSIDYYNGTTWGIRLGLGNTTNSYYNDTHRFWNAAASVQSARLTTSVASFGATNYSAATNPAPTMALGATVNGAGNVESGVYVSDSYANVRGGFVATADGATSGEIGINYTYSNAVSGFYFKRVGTNIFRYNEQGIALYGGLELRHWGADGQTVLVQKVDTAGAAYWNTSLVTAYQWYMDGALILKMLPGALALNRYDGGNFCNIQLVTNTTDISANDGCSLDFYEGGTITGWLRTYRDGLGSMELVNPAAGILAIKSAGAIGLDVSGVRYCDLSGGSFNMYDGKEIRYYGPGNTGTLAIGKPASTYSSINEMSGNPIIFNIAGVENFRVVSGGTVWYNGRSISMLNAANSVNAEIKCGDVQGELLQSSRGAMHHWENTGLTSGKVSVGTADPATTGTPGVMFLVYE